jgi:Protein of unknown function (DUF4242)
VLAAEGAQVPTSVRDAVLARTARLSPAARRLSTWRRSRDRGPSWICSSHCYLRYWVDEDSGSVFCLVEAPTSEAANTVHRDAHGLVADEIFQVQEGA